MDNQPPTTPTPKRTSVRDGWAPHHMSTRSLSRQLSNINMNSDATTTPTPKTTSVRDGWAPHPMSTRSSSIQPNINMSSHATTTPNPNLPSVREGWAPHHMSTRSSSKQPNINMSSHTTITPNPNLSSLRDGWAPHPMSTRSSSKQPNINMSSHETKTPNPNLPSMRNSRGRAPHPMSTRATSSSSKQPYNNINMDSHATTTSTPPMNSDWLLYPEPTTFTSPLIQPNNTHYQQPSNNHSENNTTSPNYPKPSPNTRTNYSNPSPTIDLTGETRPSSPESEYESESESESGYDYGIHHALLTLAYPACENSHRHVVEYFHTPQNCNRTAFIQSAPCTNTPIPAPHTNNPRRLPATHYRLTTSSPKDSAPIPDPSGKCPVCEQRDLEKDICKTTEEDQRTARDLEVQFLGRDEGSWEKEREAKRMRLWNEMPFLEISRRDRRGKWVDRRPYKNMLPGVRKDSMGVDWPLGEYRGLNRDEDED